MMSSNGIAAILMEPDASRRSARADSSRTNVERAPSRQARDIDGENTAAVGQEFENLLRSVAGLRESEAYADDFARQVAEANRHAAANQRITDDDLRVADEQPRSGERRSAAREEPSRAGAVTIQRGELGKGELGHLYRPLSAKGNQPQGEPNAGASPVHDPAKPRRSAGHGLNMNGKTTRKGTDPVVSERSLGGKKIPEALGTPGKSVGGAEARVSASAMDDTAARSAVRRQGAPLNSRNSPAGERLARPVQPQVRQSVAQRSGEPGPQGQARQEGELGARDMKKSFDSPARTDSASKTKNAGSLSKPVEQKTLNDVQRVLLANRGERHSRVRLQLRPAELGKLTIEMRMENDTLRIRFEAERPEVGQMLKQNATALSNALVDQGISVERYEVVLSEEASEFGEFGQQLDAHGGLRDSSSESDAQPASEGSGQADRLEDEEGQDGEQGPRAVGADLRLDIKA